MSDELQTLLLKIEMPAEMADQVLAYDAGQRENMSEGIPEMAVQLRRALSERTCGRWERLPETVYVDTMKAFTRFVFEYRRYWGFCGFDRAFWTVRQAEARIFRIGELEYELRDGDAPFVDVHIPSDAVLEAGRLNDSVHNAQAFLGTYFPDFAGTEMKCSSWLLSPALDAYLGKHSRIRDFRSAFDCEWDDPRSRDILQWVFGVPEGQWDRTDPVSLPENTSLQRALKKLVMDGGTIGTGKGTLRKCF